MTTPDQPTGMNELHAILNKCPYRQHAPECRPFHSAMHEAEAAIQQIVEGCLPEMKNVGDAALSDITYNRGLGYNSAIDDIRHNLQQAGLLRGDEG